MAAQTTHGSYPTASANIESPAKSKKRKHEDELRRSSSKKRKHDTIETAAPSPKLTNRSEALSSEKSSERDKKRKSKERARAEEPEHAVEDATSNGTASTEAERQVREAAADDVNLSPRSEKKNKKTKNRKNAKVPSTEQTTDETRLSETSAPAHSDIDLPDAQTTIDDKELTTSLLDTTITSSTLPQIADLLASPDISPFYSTRLSLYLSLPAVALSTQHALSSLLAHHLSPLLLTYFPPARGIVLAFSDPVLSARAAGALSGAVRPPHPAAVAPTSRTIDSATGDVKIVNAQGQETGSAAEDGGKEILAQAADEFGACWAWLTVTLLVFRPERGDEMIGWTNVVSEGFVGVVAYNYFQAAVGKERIPDGWRWSVDFGAFEGTTRKKGRKGRLGDGVLGASSGQNHNATDATADEGETQTKVYGKRYDDDDTGHFVNGATGEKVSEVLKFRVVDTEMVPGHDAGSLSLQIDATLLDEEAEKKVLAEDKARFERQTVQRQQRRNTADAEADVVMSGGLNGT